TSLTLNWVDEIHRWTNLKAETTGNLTPAKRAELYKRFRNGEFDVLVISRTLVRNDINLLLFLDIELMMIDEAHFLRNYKTKQSETMFRLGDTMAYRYVITGTPASNNNDDVYGLLKFLYPTKYPSYWQFVERYFKVIDGFFGKKIGDFKSTGRKKEFWETIEEVSVQHKLHEVMKWLPKTQYQTIRLEMNKKQQKMYKDMLDLFMVQGTELSAPSVLAQLTRLRQITVAPEMLELDAPSVKEEFILEWLADNPDEQVLIFSNFSSYLKRLQQKIKGSRLIIGDTSQKERQDIVQAFQSGKSRIILANIVAAGEGLTLDRAGTVIFLDRAYNPNNNEQAEARIIATSEQSEVQKALIIDLVCKDSVDEKILKMVKQKKNITKIVNDYKSIQEFIL